MWNLALQPLRTYHLCHDAYGHQTWQGGGLPWRAPTHKIACGHVLRDNMTNLKLYISTTTMPVATERGRKATYLEGLLPIKSHDLWSRGLFKGSLEKVKALYLQYHKSSFHQTCPSGGLQWEAPTYKVTWPFYYAVLRDNMTNWKPYISTTTMPMATKLHRKVKYLQGLLPITSHDPWHVVLAGLPQCHNTHGHQSWQDGDLLWRTRTSFFTVTMPLKIWSWMACNRRRTCPHTPYLF